MGQIRDDLQKLDMKVAATEDALRITQISLKEDFLKKQADLKKEIQT